MKLTKETLKRIIKEELEAVTQEQDVLEEVDLNALKKLHQKYKDGQISQKAFEKAKKLFYNKQDDMPSTKNLDLDTFDDPDDKNKEKSVEKLGQVKQGLQKILNQI